MFLHVVGVSDFRSCSFNKLIYWLFEGDKAVVDEVANGVANIANERCDAVARESHKDDVNLKVFECELV
jgi:hypothetical protein